MRNGAIRSSLRSSRNSSEESRATKLIAWSNSGKRRSFDARLMPVKCRRCVRSFSPPTSAPGNFTAILQAGGVQLLDLETLNALRNDESVIRWGLSRMARYTKLSDELIVPNADQDVSFFYDSATRKLRKRFDFYPEALDATVRFANELERTHTELLKQIQAERQLPESDFTIRDFRFTSGETLPELRLHYRTLGKPEKDAQGKTTNAVLIMHGTTGSGAQFIRPEFARELFGAGQPLDATKFFIVLPDGIGHGKSSKPSDGMHAKFPRYGYLDMIEADYRLLTDALGVNHARLVMGTSMGGMHTWLWGELHPDFMDALMPLASLPTQISGRNRGWRRTVIDAIRSDPTWNGGEYKTQPPSLRTAAELLWFMSSNPVLRQKEAPTLAKTDEVLDKFVEQIVKADDANDVLYAVEASHDYDPDPNLEKIRVPLLAINSADDLINPPELGILEREIKRVPHGRAILIPMSDKTRGHGSHTIATLWKDELVNLLKETKR